MNINIKKKWRNDKEMVGVESALKALNAFPRDGGAWEVDAPTSVIAGLQSLLATLEADVKKLPDTSSQSSAVVFPEKEHDVRYQLLNLYDEWIKSLSEREKELFNMDGFYPYYFSRKVKILFIAREAYSMAKKDYISTIYKAYFENTFNSWSLNQYPFHRSQFYLAYGILHAAHNKGKWPSWNDVPYATDLVNKGKFATDDGISWAFMNLSKLSNETGNWQLDQSQYDSFLSNEQNRKMIRKEIELLRPDLIIGSNVYELSDILGYDKEKVDATNSACYYYHKTNTLPPFLNCYHFSAIKSDNSIFYEPVREVLSNHRDECNWMESK